MVAGGGQQRELRRHGLASRQHRRNDAEGIGHLLRAGRREQQVLYQVHQRAGNDDADGYIGPERGRIVVMQRQDHGSAARGKLGTFLIC